MIADDVIAVMITGVSTFFISLIILEFENKKENSLCFNCLGIKLIIMKSYMIDTLMHSGPQYLEIQTFILC